MIKKFIKKISIVIIWECSYFSKFLFNKNIISKYKYNDEIFCYDKNILSTLEKRYSKSKFWENEEDYSLSVFFPHRFAKQYELVFEKFLPRLDNNAIIADFGCASGEWTLKVAPFCKKIYGFDYSKELIKSAEERAKIENRSNAIFEYCDIRNIPLDVEYDGVMLLGVLMYIDDCDKLYEVLKSINSCMKKGSLLITKDTLNMENRDVMFMYNKRNGYRAVYWSPKIYFEQFRKAGFNMVEKFTMDEVNSKHTHFIAEGAVWEKL